MKSLQLDFSNLRAKRKQRYSVILLAVLVAVFLAAIVVKGKVDKQVGDLENAMLRSSGHQVVRTTKPTDADLRRVMQADVIQKKLNFPWQDLLHSLELVKRGSPAITLTAIQPDTSKNIVLISGEGRSLEGMLAFVSLLEKQSTFHDVFLVNQRDLGESSEPEIGFTIKMGWHI